MDMEGLKCAWGWRVREGGGENSAKSWETDSTSIGSTLRRILEPFSSSPLDLELGQFSDLPFYPQNFIERRISVVTNSCYMEMKVLDYSCCSSFVTILDIAKNCKSNCSINAA